MKILITQLAVTVPDDFPANAPACLRELIVIKAHQWLGHCIPPQCISVTAKTLVLPEPIEIEGRHLGGERSFAG